MDSQSAQTVLEWVSRYGYFAIFGMLMFGIIGVPVPDETMLASVGYLAHKGRLGLFPAYLVAWTGTMSGITSSYLLGRYVGCAFLKKYGWFFHVTDDRLARVERWFEHGGRWVLAVGYFVPGLRHVFAIAAGSSKLPFHIFALFAYAGGLFWTATFITLGYVVGDAWEKALAKGDVVIYVLSGIAVLVLAGFLFLRWYLRRRRTPA